MEAPQPPPFQFAPGQGPPTRFEMELEFVTMLGAPDYLMWLASQKYFQKPGFKDYLQYLQYWSTEPYLRYLTHPGPTLKALELLQEEKFQKDILRPEIGRQLNEEMLEWAARRHAENGGT